MSELLVTAAQMRALERAAIDSGTVTGLELMERAGRGAIEAILAEWPDLARAPGRAVVLCGPGNNGGDGFVVARLLRQRGWEVECFLYGDAEKLPSDARVNYERWIDTGAVHPLTEIEAEAFWDRTLTNSPDGPWSDLHVDALFGTGLTRPIGADLGHAAAAFLEDMAELDAVPAHLLPRVVALDVPSGICADSGRLLEPTIMPNFRADLTVSFGRYKVGQTLANSAARSGRLRLVDIGMPEPTFVFPAGEAAGLSREFEARSQPVLRVTEAQAKDWAGRPTIVTGPFRVAKDIGHKFSHGHALILSGGVGRGGAARLAARAALRVGAGLVTVAPPPAALIENACRLDAIMLRSLRDADVLADLLRDDRLTALCLGPGLGLGAREAALVARAISSGLPAVLDADALTLIAQDNELSKALHEGCVLTPHMGEFARLAPDLAEKLNAPAETGPAYSKVDATRDLAARLGATVLLKGPDTVIADPSGEAAIHSAAYGREAPWLATAGAGDVLAGMIAGLLARGFSPKAACEAAAWLHVEAARAFGPGLIAEDLPEMIPQVLAALEAPN